MPDGYLSPSQVADVLPGLSERWLARRRAEGTGPRYVKIGNRILYSRADLFAYLAAHTVDRSGRDV